MALVTNVVITAAARILLAALLKNLFVPIFTPLFSQCFDKINKIKSVCTNNAAPFAESFRAGKTNKYKRV
jgi:hypothetical protein